MVGPVQFTELVGLGRGDAAERLAGDVFRGRNLIINNENLLVIRHRGDGVSVLAALDDDIGKHAGLDERPDTVVDDDDIVVRAFTLQIVDAVPDGFLAAFSTGNHPL